jgi:hypothetical protein
MKHLQSFEGFLNEGMNDEPPMFDYDNSDLSRVKKNGGGYVTFYPRKPGGHHFTIADDQDVREMRKLLSEAGTLYAYSVGFGPYYHESGAREPKSMVVLLHATGEELRKQTKVVGEIVDRRFSRNYAH